MTEIEINEGFRMALDLMENSNKNVFITGRAGTGKSTLLSYFQQNTNKKVAVLAPTGVAALNVRARRYILSLGLSPTSRLIRSKRSAHQGVQAYL